MNRYLRAIVILSDDDLRAVISGCITGSSPPYDHGSEKEIESYLNEVVAELRQSKLLECEADFAHYGSGFASYVHVFCAKRGGKSTIYQEDADRIDGVAVYLCRLAPIAASGPEQRRKHYRRSWFGRRKVCGGSFGFLEAEKVDGSPPGDWTEEINEIRCKLHRFGFLLPGREELARRLPFQAQIPTILGGPIHDRPYQVFDAVFYWED